MRCASSACRPFVLHVVEVPLGLVAEGDDPEAVALVESAGAGVPGEGVEPKRSARLLLRPAQELRADSAAMKTLAYVKLRDRGGRRGDEPHQPAIEEGDAD